MLRENTIFAQERWEYQKMMNTNGIYSLGSFVPENIKNVNNFFVQMVPTENSELMFNTVRNAFDYMSFEEAFKSDPTIYMASGITSKVITDRIHGTDTVITNITSEYLDNVGIYSGLQSIRLVELTEDNDTYYYVLVGGKGAIEAKADEMYNAENVVYNGEPFQIKEGHIALDGISIVDLALAMANELFGRNWTVDDPIRTQPIFAVESSNAIDMEEFEKWRKLEEYRSWTDAVRLGAIFAIKK